MDRIKPPTIWVKDCDCSLNLTEGRISFHTNFVSRFLAVAPYFCTLLHYQDSIVTPGTDLSAISCPSLLVDPCLGLRIRFQTADLRVVFLFVCSTSVTCIYPITHSHGPLVLSFSELNRL